MLTIGATRDISLLIIRFILIISGLVLRFFRQQTTGIVKPCIQA